ncbi:MAG: Calx-beta domain-containing protein [Isosphaeraceae bacterium]|nr:Calx-beta domain-containing protein [Isosphaeraceae bacterium]
MSSSRLRRWLSPKSPLCAERTPSGARRAALRCDWEACEPRALLSLAISNVTVEESPAPQVATADFTVTLDAPNSGTVTVDYSTRDGTAKANLDYSPVQGTLTFAPGTTSETIQVPVISNPASTTDSTFYVSLSNPVDDTISPSAAEGAAVLLLPPATPAANTTTATSSNSAPQTPVTGVSTNTAASLAGTTTAVPGVASAPRPPSSTPANVQTPTTTNPLGSPSVAGTVTPPSSATAVSLITSAVPAASTPAPKADPLVVTNTNDTGPGSLRNAIETALAEPGKPVITFNVNGTAPIVIKTQSPLPAITRPLTIDGTTQPGYHGTPLVTIDGAQAGAGANGLVISGGNSTVEGLAIVQFAGSGVLLQTAGGNTISGDDLGTDRAGDPGLGNGADGIRIDGSPGNKVGGTEANAGDVIAGNGLVGIRIVGASSTGNVIQGSLIGTTPDGSEPLGNRTDGVFIDGASGNTVGGTVPAARNVISGNGSVGLQIDGNAASANQMVGNDVGTDVSGTKPVGNGRDGVFLDGAPGNSIGGSAAGAGNVIAANAQVGLQLFGPSARNNVIQGNRIGQGAGGEPLGNAVGLYVNHARGNTVGGPGTAANTITGSTRANVIPAAAGRTQVKHPATTPSHHATTHGTSGSGGLHIGSLDLSSLLGGSTSSTAGKSAGTVSQALSLLGRLGNQNQGQGN